MANFVKFLDRSDCLKSGRSVILSYMRRQRRRWYEVSDNTQKGRGSVVNPFLAQLLPRKVSDVCSSISGSDMLHLEEAVCAICVIQNYQFWIFGAVSRLVKLGDAVPDKDVLMSHAVNSIQYVMQIAARETTTCSFKPDDF